MAFQKSLGTVRFIGELYKHKMLTAKILHECTRKLMSLTPNEQALEALCALLTTAGKDLEVETNDAIKRIGEDTQQVSSILCRSLSAAIGQRPTNYLSCCSCSCAPFG